MIRLAIATVILAVALVLVRRRQRRSPGAETLRVTSRTGISRGVLAAVLEVEERRFLVTITASSTTLVAELGSLPAAAFGPVPAAVPPALAGAPTAVRPTAAHGPETADAASFLERIRARTVRTFDAELSARAEAAR